MIDSLFLLQLSKTTKSLCWELSELFPDCSEYVVRVGWMPDGNHIWIQLLNRPQTQLKIVVVSIEAFILDGHSDPTLRSADAVHTPLVYELLEENSDVWINVRYSYLWSNPLSIHIAFLLTFMISS